MLFWSTTLNQRYYEPDSYKINPYRLPSSVYPTIVYDGGLFVSLHCGDVPIISKPYPPGTQLEEPSSSNDTVRRSGTYWTFRLTLPPCHSTSFCSTTVPPNPSQLGTCLLSFPNHKQLTLILPRHTFSLCFFVSTPRFCSTMKVDITKGISSNL